MKIILLGYCFIILLGTVLLRLPAAVRDSSEHSILTAFFTATSSTCVTGLIRADTYTNWTLFGQAVILMLIQIGGMGVVTAAAAISMLAGRRIGLKERWVMQESISAPQVGGIVPYDEIYFSGDSTHRRNRCAAACVLLLPPAGARKRHMVFRISQHFRIL